MIRVGLVGFGLAGRVFHAPVISAVEGLELAAIVERSSREAEKAYPAVATYTSLEALLADTSIELIVVATPNTSHASLARQALEAGRYVVVDKPTAVTSAEIAALIQLSKDSNHFLIPFHNRRWDSDFQTLQKLLHEQTLSRIVSFESTFDRWRQLPRTGLWRESGGPGSGMLLDLGTHLADQALQLFGLPEAVGAEVRCERDGAVSNDAFTVRLYYPSLIATLGATCLASLPRPRYTVRGTEGNFVKNGLDPQEARLRENPESAEHEWGEQPESDWGTLAVLADDKPSSRIVQPVASAYRLYYAGVRDAILGKAEQPVQAIDAWRTARILEWAEESSKEQRVIPCDWTQSPAY
jgi:scyllo-inositol 2-dehydrogenase (NADP+)